MNPDPTRQAQFTRHFAESERALQAFAFSLVPNRADADPEINRIVAKLEEPGVGLRDLAEQVVRSEIFLTK